MPYCLYMRLKNQKCPPQERQTFSNLNMNVYVCFAHGCVLRREGLQLLFILMLTIISFVVNMATNIWVLWQTANVFSKNQKKHPKRH